MNTTRTILEHPRLSITAKYVGIVLALNAKTNAGAGPWLSMAELEKQTALDAPTIYRALALLRRAGFCQVRGQGGRFLDGKRFDA